MIVTPYSALFSDVGPYWEAMGGAWGGRWKDEIHFELPGARQRADAYGKGLQGQTGGTATVASAAAHAAVDAVIGMIPGVGEVELVATVLQWFPFFAESEILAVLASPSRVLF